jgi:protein-disulfide isomerase
MMQSSLSGRVSAFVNVLVIGCALIVTYAVLDKLILHPVRPPGPPTELTAQKDWEALFVTGQLAGPEKDSVGMVIFSDYECPACLALHEQLIEYEQRGELPFAVLYRHWPLSKHKFAEHAAVAAECAGVQGRFRQMHDSLFANQSELGVIPWTELAARAAVPDVDQFERCLKDEDILTKVRSDAGVAKTLASRGTPTVILAGGARFVGVPAKHRLDSLISAALGSAVPSRSTRP